MDENVKHKINNFFSKSPLKHLKKGAKLLTPDSPINSCYCLINGVIRMFSYTEKGDEITINLFRPTSFFPVGNIINETPNRYYYDAVTDVDYYASTKQDFIKFMGDNPDVIFDLLKRIYHGLDGFFMRLESHSGSRASNKVLVELLILLDRFDNNIELTHYQLASLAGLSRETVTREIAKLKKVGVVKSKGRKIIIANREALLKKIQN